MSTNDLARVEEVRQRTGAGLSVTFARLGLIAEEDLARAIADFRQLRLVSRADFPQERLAIPGINRRFLSRHAVLPLEIANDTLVVAMADPDDDEAKAGLAFASSLAISPRVATFADIDDALATGEAAGDDLSVFSDDLAGGRR